MRTVLYLLFAFLVLECKKPPVIEEYRFVSASSGLRLRKTPDLKADKIATIGNGAKVRVVEKGEPVEVDGIRSNWLQIDFLGQKGWAFGGYLTKPTKKPDPQWEKFMGTWRGKNECKGEHTHLLIHPDFTYEGWLLDTAGAACVGHAITGTWSMELSSICLVDPTRACYEYGKGGLLLANQQAAPALKEGAELLMQLKK